MRYQDSEKVGWTKIESLTTILAKKLSNTKFSSISTISRGGLVPARLLADHLAIDKILVDKDTIPINSLFVDDIYDSGDTFRKIISKVDDPQNFVYATLFARKGKKYPKQLVFAQKTRGNEYIIYPWDKLEHKRLKKLGL
ncbi:MAG: phosphoribosyltransferase [Nitrosopumilaceae archaeon]|nr:phosphoribosyltransferase [Nitrosopumilaceae archaeon]